MYLFCANKQRLCLLSPKLTAGDKGKQTPSVECNRGTACTHPCPCEDLGQRTHVLQEREVEHPRDLLDPIRECRLALQAGRDGGVICGISAVTVVRVAVRGAHPDLVQQLRAR